MSYIGVQKSNHLSPSFIKEDFTGNGSSTEFTLTNEVPGKNEDNLMVVLSNVIQEPTSAYTIKDDASGNGKILKFSTAPTNGETIYVVHHGVGTFLQKPSPGSVGTTELAANLKTFTTDAYTANGSTDAFTLTEAPNDISGILVFVDGILQKASTNYSLGGSSGNIVTFTATPINGSEIEVKHLGIRSVQRRGTDFMIDNFSGNGSLQAFNLSQSTTTNNAFVYYNGVMMKPTEDYSVAGATLTFTFTPQNASEIMVRYQG